MFLLRIAYALLGLVTAPSSLAARRNRRDTHGFGSCLQLVQPPPRLSVASAGEPGGITVNPNHAHPRRQETRGMDLVDPPLSAPLPNKRRRTPPWRYVAMMRSAGNFWPSRRIPPDKGPAILFAVATTAATLSAASATSCTIRRRPLLMDIRQVRNPVGGGVAYVPLPPQVNRVGRTDWCARVRRKTERLRHRLAGTFRTNCGEKNVGGLPFAEGAGRRPRAAVRRSRVHGSLDFRSIALNARRLSKSLAISRRRCPFICSSEHRLPIE